MITMTKRQLVSRLVRFLTRVEEHHQEIEEIYAFDSQVDGGEFCGPALGRQFERDCNDIARRLGFASADVADEVARRFHVHI